MRLTKFCVAVGAFALAGSLLAQSPSDRAGEPHLLVDVSAGLVNAMVHRQVDRTEPFKDVIKDVPNEGVHRTIASVGAELVPDRAHAACDIVITGCTYARSTGFKRIAQIHTTSITPFVARYRVALDAWGFRGLCGLGSATTHIDLVGSVDRFGERDSTATNIVRLGFNRDRDELETIVATRTRMRASARLEAELVPMLNAANRNVAVGYAWATDAGLRFAALDFKTTPTHMQARLRIATPGRPGPSAAPAAPAKNDLSLRVHQTLLNEVGRAALGGKTFRAAELMELAQRLTTPLFRDARTQAEQDAGRKAIAVLLGGKIGKSATVTLAPADPITLAIGAKEFTIEVHMAAGQLNGIALPEARVRATYRVENTAAGVLVVRLGAIEIRPAGGAKTGAAFAPFVRLLAGEILKERMALADLSLPAGLVAARLKVTNGWLTASWKLR